MPVRRPPGRATGPLTPRQPTGAATGIGTLSLPRPALHQVEAHVDIIRTVKRIEWATGCRWWLLAILLLVAARLLLPGILL